MKPAAFASGAVLTVAVGLGLVVGVAAGVGAIGKLGYEPSVLKATSTGPHTAELTLSTFGDSYVCHDGGGDHPDWVTFCPTTSLEVPADSVVTITIKQYDTGEALHNPYFATVRGTVGGTMTLNGTTVDSIPPDKVAHTFTIQSPTDSRSPLDVNVPLAPVADNAPDAVTIAGHQYPAPNIITFQIRTGAPGTYVWHCYFPCGTGLAGGELGFGGAMATTGYMAGTLQVTAD